MFGSSTDTLSSGCTFRQSILLHFKRLEQSGTREGCFDPPFPAEDCFYTVNEEDHLQGCRRCFQAAVSTMIRTEYGIHDIQAPAPPDRQRPHF